MTGHSPSPGRPRRAGAALALAAAAMVGLVLLAVWLLGGRGEESGGTTSGGATGAAAAGDAPPAAPAFAGEPQALAAGDVAAPSADAVSAPGAATPAGSAVARWTGAISTFTGVVVDHEGRPLSGATVTCWPNESTREALGMAFDCLGPEIDPALSTTTGDDGRFVLRAPHLDPIRTFDSSRIYPWLLVEADGFAVRGVQCLGAKAGDFDAGTIAVEPGGSLIGRTVDEQGQPVAGARLRARQDRFEPRVVATKEDYQAHREIDPVVSDISGDDGRFELGGFWPGAATTWFTAEGYLFSERELEPIEVGARRDLGDIVLPSGGTLSGLVVDDAGAPVAGAAVFATEHDTLRNKPNTHDTVLYEIGSLWRYGASKGTSDAGGHFTLTGLQPANLRVFVDAQGFEPLLVGDVAAGPQELRLELVRQAMLSLVVHDEESGAPLAGAVVEAVRRGTEKRLGYDSQLLVRAGPGPGEFVVERIGTWRTDLAVSAPGYATRGFAIEGAKPPQALERTVSLVPESRLTGRVLRGDGQPIAGAVVSTVAPKDADIALPARSATAGADGRYELAALAGGEWTLRATAEGFVAVERTVTLPASGTLADTDFRLEAGATIFGTYFDADDRPVPGKKIDLDRETEDVQEDDRVNVFSDARGDYSAAGLRAGRWAVGDEPPVMAEVAAGESLRVDVREIKPASIRGQVFAGGRPKTGVLVMALDRSTEEQVGFALPRATVKVDAEGRYEFQVDPGEWYLQAAGFDPPCGGSSTVPLTLAPGEQRVVDLAFSGERLSILVVEAGTGRPLEGVAMSLQRATESDPLTPGFSLGNKGDRTEFWPHTDAAGHAELPFVLPGSYEYSCWLDGYVKPPARDVAITAGQPVELRIELQPETTLRGTAKLASGVPVKDGLYLTLRRPDQPGEKWKLGMTENGAFIFEELPAGEYLLELWPKYAPSTLPPKEPALVELPVTLKAGESKSIELVVPNSP